MECLLAALPPSTLSHSHPAGPEPSPLVFSAATPPHPAARRRIIGPPRSSFGRYPPPSPHTWGSPPTWSCVHWPVWSVLLRLSAGVGPDWSSCVIGHAAHAFWRATRNDRGSALIGAAPSARFRQAGRLLLSPADPGPGPSPDPEGPRSGR